MYYVGFALVMWKLWLFTVFAFKHIKKYNTKLKVANILQGPSGMVTGEVRVWFSIIDSGLFKWVWNWLMFYNVYLNTPI